jgi:hypothetical protein
VGFAYERNILVGLTNERKHLYISVPLLNRSFEVLMLIDTNGRHCLLRPGTILLA